MLTTSSFARSCQHAVLVTVLAVVAVAQLPTKAKLEEMEREDLQRTLQEAQNINVEVVRGLERFLKKWPNAARKADLQRALFRASSELRDDARMLRWGQEVLKADPTDLVARERVARVLLQTETAENARLALPHAEKLEAGIRESFATASPKVRDDAERALTRAMVYQARAKGLTGDIAGAIETARKAYGVQRSAENMREIARWEEKAGHIDLAMEAYAEAFSFDDARNSDEERAKDRAKLGQMFRDHKGGEAGLGDLLLRTYDRLQKDARMMRAKQAELDPNRVAEDLYGFRLESLDGAKRTLESLKGKVVVLDFWATWCGPCRKQHALYKEVQKRFANRNDVVFLYINTDEDRSAVRPFLEEQKWDKDVYFDPGMAALYSVSSIPTTILIDRQGRMGGRMNGFIPERFVDMLSERVTELLAEPVTHP